LSILTYLNISIPVTIMKLYFLPFVNAKLVLTSEQTSYKTVTFTGLCQKLLEGLQAFELML